MCVCVCVCVCVCCVVVIIVVVVVVDDDVVLCFLSFFRKEQVEFPYIILTQPSQTSQ